MLLPVLLTIAVMTAVWLCCSVKLADLLNILAVAVGLHVNKYKQGGGAGALFIAKCNTK